MMHRSLIRLLAGLVLWLPLGSGAQSGGTAWPGADAAARLVCNTIEPLVGEYAKRVEVTAPDSEGRRRAVLNGRVTHVDVQAEEGPIRPGLSRRVASGDRRTFESLSHLESMQNVMIMGSEMSEPAVRAAVAWEDVRRMRAYPLDPAPHKFGMPPSLVELYDDQGRLMERLYVQMVFPATISVPCR